MKYAVTFRIKVKDQEDRVVNLTEREVEVIRPIFAGKSNKEVGVELVCSKRTVDFHLANIYAKLGVSNRVQAMRFVASQGMAAYFGIVEEPAIGLIPVFQPTMA